MEELLLRLNVYISSSGYCSRQQADRYIKGGYVTVNGNITTNKTFVNKSDEVYVNDHLIQPKENSIYIMRSEEHTSELQSRGHLVCRLLLEKKKNKHRYITS